MVTSVCVLKKEKGMSVITIVVCNTSALLTKKIIFIHEFIHPAMQVQVGLNWTAC